LLNLQPMYLAKPGSPETELRETINGSVDVIPVDNIDVFPDPGEEGNLATLYTDEEFETIKYTGKTGSSPSDYALTGCTRGFQGDPQEWSQGSSIARTITAYDLDTLKNNLNEICKLGQFSVKKYSYSYTAEGETSEFEIPLETFSESTDVVMVFQNTVFVSPDLYTIYEIEGTDYLVLNTPVEDGTVVVILVLKLLYEYDFSYTGSINGELIAVDTMPGNRITDDSIDDSKLQSDIDGSLIEEDSLPGNRITDDSIDDSKLQSDIDGSLIEEDSLPGNRIEGDYVKEKARSQAIIYSIVFG